ncbi:OmpA family protein [Geomobilimonas luticola]|uniref:OmpA family protein n=1 Tax=Geomobilimonas luticola TaxID=1114878 RepID=A0ABS5SCS7_9BACT|nr:OmpA family protein [Geomobilimonas luticola]MBT0653183.1 OmpA family protein [Geomobilimonas luticola]
MKKILFITMGALVLSAPCAFANPSQSGVTGLLAVPSADTLDSGNLCVGIWGDLSKNKETGKHAVVMPAALTLGIGSFWEIYGSYPNLLFNDQQELANRGTANLGTKLRIFGKRNANFKLATDIFAMRHVSDNPDINGVTDVGGRLIASFFAPWFAVHAYGGYLSPGNRPGTAMEDQILYGGGVEFSPTSRTKLTLELTGSQNSKSGTSSKDAPIESLVGFQYYVSPHLTINAGAGARVNSVGQDWRAIIGFTTCQGVGTYIKPVPRLVMEPEAKPQEAVKAAKIAPISSLLLKSTAVTPASKIELPVDPDREEIVIKPFGQVVIPPQPQRAQTTLPVMPVLQTMPVLTQQVPLPPRKEEVRVAPQEVVATGDEQVEGQTPLLAVEVKGEKVEVLPGGTQKLPETVKVYRKFRFPDVMFEFGQMDLSEEVKRSLSEVAEQIRADKKTAFIRIDGHTDSIGSDKYNMDLSLKRAIAVANHLITREGIDPKTLFVKGMGKTRLLSDNVTTEGRRINRRFEIMFLVPKGK